jgi:hypothetical protein
LQRLEVVIAVMLARERRWPADAATDGCTELAAALAALPSRPLEMVADAVVALDRPTDLGCEIPEPFAGGDSDSSVYSEDESDDSDPFGRFRNSW